MHSNSEFKIALIGTGNIAVTMADAISKSGEAEVVSVASRDRDRAERFAKEHGIANAYESYDELIGSDGYDLIYVSTINPLHFGIASACLKAGKPVIVEKPICMKVDEVRELIRLSRETNTFLAEAMPLRYSSNMKTVKELVDNGSIGKVRLLVSNIGIDCWGVPRIREKSMGGGALYDLGVYGLTISDMVFPDEPEDIVSACNIENEVDSQNTVVISYKDAQSMLFSSVKLQTKGAAVIYGDRGRIFIHKAYNADKVVKYAGFRSIKTYRNKENRYAKEITACKRAILDGRIEPYEYTHDDMLKIYEKVDGVLRKK